jgi:hypothetical protein
MTKFFSYFSEIAQFFKGLTKNKVQVLLVHFLFSKISSGAALA